jgi:hypothetical protein
MAPRIFVSFAKEDVSYRDLLVGQMKNRNAPFDFIDMSLPEPFDSRWKTQCRDKIRACHGFIALLSKKTWRADGARWEMRCAAEERIPTLAIHIHRADKGAIPPELSNRRAVEWNQSRIAEFVGKVQSKRGFWNRLFDL